MKVCTCLLLFGIFAYTNSTTRDKPKNDDISVNLAHANVSESSNVEYSEDTNNISNVRKFITRETTAIDKNKTMKPEFKAARAKRDIVRDFIQEAVNIINTYEDTTFKVFFRILDNEIRRYHYRDCKFSELMQNPDTRSWLAGVLQMTRGKSVSSMKANINKMADMMRYKIYGNDVTELLDYINSLYRHTEPILHRVLIELKDYGKTKSLRVHRNIIKRGIRHILFDHYTALDSDTRRELNVRIETFWKQFKNNPASSAEVTSRERNAVIDSIKVTQNVKHKVKEFEKRSKNDLNTNLKNESERSVSIHDGDTKLNVSDSGQNTENVLKVKSKVKPRSQHGKPDKSKSKSKHAKTHIVAEYNAEIDVQLANTELLKSLGIFKPVHDKKLATTSDQGSVTPTKPTIKPSGLRTGPEIKLKKPTHGTINEYLNPLSKLRSQITSLFSKESKVVIQLMNDNNIIKARDTTTQRKRKKNRTKQRPRTREKSRKRHHQEDSS